METNIKGLKDRLGNKLHIIVQSIAQVVGLQEALNGKANINHTHEGITRGESSAEINNSEKLEVVTNGLYLDLSYSDSEITMDVNTAERANNLKKAIEHTPASMEDLAGKADQTHYHNDSDVTCISSEYPEGKPLDEVLHSMDTALNNKIDIDDFGGEDVEVLTATKEEPIDIESCVGSKRFCVVYIESQSSGATLEELISGCVLKDSDAELSASYGSIYALIVFNTGYNRFAFVSPNLDV